jgi:hypothetical protein
LVESRDITFIDGMRKALAAAKQGLRRRKPSRFKIPQERPGAVDVDKVKKQGCSHRSRNNEYQRQGGQEQYYALAHRVDQFPKIIDRAAGAQVKNIIEAT